MSQSAPTGRLGEARGDAVATREQLIERYMPVARQLAGKYRSHREHQDDLEQVAYLGLLKAVDRYDPDRGPFPRYAVPTILGELKRHFRDNGWGVRVPRLLQERYLIVSAAVDELSGELGRSPTVADIAGHIGHTPEEVSEALAASSAHTPTALDAPFPGDPDGRTLGGRLGTDEHGYNLVEINESISPAFRALPEREQTILRLRFGDDLKQADIAKLVGISQMHVSRLLRSSIERLTAAADGSAQPS